MRIVLCALALVLSVFGVSHIRAVGAGYPPALYVDVLLPLLLGVLLLSVAFFGNRTWRQRTLLLTLASYPALLCADVCLLFAFGAPVLKHPPSEPAKSQSEVAAALQERGAEVFSLYLASGFDRLKKRHGTGLLRGSVLPIGHVAGATVLRDAESGTWLSYKADEYGFNNDTGAHREGDVDVALIGDSFVNGTGVSREHDIAGHLRSAGLSVVNLGVSGHGPLSNLAVQREYAIPLRPRWIAWFFYEGNDLKDLEGELSTDLVRYLNPEFSQGLRQRQAECDSALRQLMGRVPFTVRRPMTVSQRALRLGGLRGQLRRLAEALAPRPSIKGARLAARIIANAREESEKAGARFLFVYLPTHERWVDPQRYGARADGARAKLLEQLDEYGVDVLDLLPAMRETKRVNDFYPTVVPSGHFNSDGYQLVAKAVHAFVQAR